MTSKFVSMHAFMKKINANIVSFLKLNMIANLFFLIVFLLTPVTSFSQCRGITGYGTYCNTYAEAVDYVNWWASTNGSGCVCSYGIEAQPELNRIVFGCKELFGYINPGYIPDCGTRLVGGPGGGVYYPADTDIPKNPEVCCDGIDNNGNGEDDEGCDPCKCNPQACQPCSYKDGSGGK